MALIARRPYNPDDSMQGHAIQNAFLTTRCTLVVRLGGDAANSTYGHDESRLASTAEHHARAPRSSASQTNANDMQAPPSYRMRARFRGAVLDDWQVLFHNTGTWLLHHNEQMPSGVRTSFLVIACRTIQANVPAVIHLVSAAPARGAYCVRTTPLRHHGRWHSEL